MNRIQQVAPVDPRILYYHPDDLMPLWKLAACKIVEIAIQAFIPFVTIMSAHALLPLSLSPVFLPVIAIGSVFSSAMIFAPRTDPVQAVPFIEIFPPGPPPVALTPNVPRGVRNAACNCWANALVQVMRCDKSLITWLKNVPNHLLDLNPNGLYWASFLPQHILFQAADLESHPAPPVYMTPLIGSPPIGRFQTPEQMADRIKVTVPEMPKEAPTAAPKKGDPQPVEAKHPEQIALEAEALELLKAKIADQTKVLSRKGGFLRLSDLTEAQRAALKGKREISFEELGQLQIDQLRRQTEVRISDLTAAQRAEYLPGVITNVLAWAIKVPEVFSLEEAVIFPANGDEIVLTDAYLNLFPANQRENATRYATSIIKELRNVAKKNQFTAEEKHALYEALAPLRTAEGFFKDFIAHPSVPHLSLEVIFANDMADQIPAEILAKFPDRDPVELSAEIRAHIQQFRDNLIANPLPQPVGMAMVGWLAAFINVRKMDTPERQELLRYVNVIHGNEVSKREGVAKGLIAMRDFFNAYDQSIRLNQRIAVEARSQNIRLALSEMSMIDPNPNAQEDPTEAFAVIEGLLPPELKVNMQTRRIVKGLEGPEGVRMNNDPSTGYLAVPLKGVVPSVKALTEEYFDKPAENDEPVRINGAEYQIDREQVQFVKAPDSLWPQLKRFNFQRPFRFLHAVMPSWFEPAPVQNVKNKDPVELSDFIDIETIEDGLVRYKLDAFIVHLGDTAKSGHYISYKCEINADGEEVWYKLDDSNVSIVTGEELANAKAQAYFPHYSKTLGPQLLN